MPSKNTMEVGRRSRVGVAGTGAGIGGVLFQGPVEVGPLNAGYHGLSGHLFFFFETAKVRKVSARKEDFQQRN